MSNPPNPYAYPSDEKNYDGSLYLAHSGMSLRDWFAGQALMGDIAAMDPDEPLAVAFGWTVEQTLARDAQRRAEWCYRQADAMLAERAKS